MTEPEWLACAEPAQLLDHLGAQQSERKLRLVGVACCRRAGILLPHDHQTLAAAEDHADGLLGDEDLMHAWWDACAANPDEPKRHDALRDSVLGAAFGIVYETEHLFEHVLDLCRVARSAQEKAPLLETIHDIFGNPFRPVTIERAWLTWNNGTIVDLARAAYDERELPSGHLDTERLAILADALEEAGCTSDDVLGHLRGPGPHVRGCWVIDLILSKDR